MLCCRRYFSYIVESDSAGKKPINYAIRSRINLVSVMYKNILVVSNILIEDAIQWMTFRLSCETNS